MNPFALIRSTFAVLVFFPIGTLFLCVVTLFAVFVLRSERVNNMLILIWGRFSCFIFNVEIEVQGRENRPAGGAILLFNHKSFFDIFALYSQFPEARFGAKIELFSIPLFGATMKALGTLPIARANREAAIRVLQDSYEAARKGRQFALSPEGGRNTGAGILPFKAGPFLLAIEAGVPIVPLVISGANEVWPKATLVPATQFWRSKIRIRVLEPISTAGYTAEHRDELQKIARERMITALSELSNP